MWPVLLTLGAVMAVPVAAVLLSKPSKDPDEERVSKIPGGRAAIAKVQLVSNNYMGRVRVSGRGIHLQESGNSAGSSKWRLRLAAAETNCNIVLNIVTYHNGEGAFISEGTAYRKA